MSRGQHEYLRITEKELALRKLLLAARKPLIEATAWGSGFNDGWSAAIRHAMDIVNDHDDYLVSQLEGR